MPPMVNPSSLVESSEIQEGIYMEEISMKPDLNCLDHDRRLTRVETQISYIERSLDTITEQTACLPEISTVLKQLTTHIESVGNNLETHKKEQVVTDKKFIEDNTVLKTKGSLVWWVVITLILGGLIGKVVISAFGG